MSSHSPESPKFTTVDAQMAVLAAGIVALAVAGGVKAVGSTSSEIPRDTFLNNAMAAAWDAENKPTSLLGRFYDEVTYGETLQVPTTESGNGLAGFATAHYANVVYGQACFNGTEYDIIPNRSYSSLPFPIGSVSYSHRARVEETGPSSVRIRPNDSNAPAISFYLGKDGRFVPDEASAKIIEDRGLTCDLGKGTLVQQMDYNQFEKTHTFTTIGYLTEPLPPVIPSTK